MDTDRGRLYDHPSIPDDLAKSYEKLALDNEKASQDNVLYALTTFLEDPEDERIVLERLASPGRRIPLEEIDTA